MQVWKRVDRDTGEITLTTEAEVREKLSRFYKNVPAVLRDASETLPACTPWASYYPEVQSK